MPNIPNYGETHPATDGAAAPPRPTIVATGGGDQPISGTAAPDPPRPTVAADGPVEPGRRELVERWRPTFPDQLACVDAALRRDGRAPRELPSYQELRLARRATGLAFSPVRGLRDVTEALQRELGLMENHAADVTVLREMGWSEAAIEVWCYPYRYDLRELYLGDTSGRLARLERAWEPAGSVEDTEPGDAPASAGSGDREENPGALRAADHTVLKEYWAWLEQNEGLHPSVDDLASACHFHTRTVQRSLAELRKRGYIPHSARSRGAAAHS